MVLKSLILVIVFLSLPTFAFDYPVSLASYDALYTSLYETRDVEVDEEGFRKISGALFFKENPTGKPLKFTYDYYSPGENNGKTIILSPNIEGTTVLERWLRDYLTNRGYNILIPYALPIEFAFGPRTPEEFELWNIQAIVGTRAIVKSLLATQVFDEENMGLLGASLGGIRSSILFGLDHRFKAAFVAVAGADFPSLYANTKNTVLRPIREAHMQYLGLRQQRNYENYLRGFLKLDTSIIKQSPYLKNYAMVIADKDTVVPAANQWRLWQSIKNTGVHPKTYISDTEHILGALQLLRYRFEIFEWFETRL